MAASARADQIQRVVHHVFLPPKLPQQADEDSEIVLANTTLQALVKLRHLLPQDSCPEILDSAVALLTNIKEINSMPGGAIDEVVLLKALKSLPVGQALAANVKAQNAAVLITRRPDELVFEEFELSPVDLDVVTTEGRLTRTFPGLAVAVPASLLDQEDFPTMIASTLSTMSHQKVPGMQPQSMKSGVRHDELRDTTNPAMISELFMGVLAGIGSPVSVSFISKNTRDEVLWDRAEIPWRRSPMWLLIRVSLQLIVSRSPYGSRALYKEIMILIMGQILDSFKNHNLPPDMVYIMAAKIARRLKKIDAAETMVLPASATERTECILEQASTSIVTSWLRSQKLDTRNLELSSLKTLDFERDTLLALPALDDYIEATHRRRYEGIASHFMPSSQLIQLHPRTLPTLADSHFDESYAAANLIRFEQWVAQRITDWLNSNKQDDACGKLHDLMITYHRLAKTYYSGNPEMTSVMILTLFELWVACDKAALRTCPWLSEYDPGIPTHALQNLLLPFLEQMKRLSDVEQYVETRRRRTKKHADLLFSSDSDKSFASQYFDRSDAHQELLSKIESAARVSRQAKREELQRAKAEYHRLDRLYNGTEHEFFTRVIDKFCNPPETEQVHSHSCQKCSYQSERDRLSIKVHEWPLPTRHSQAKAVIFELDVPSWFRDWRNARLVLLKDVLKGKRDEARSQTEYFLSINDPHLTSRHSQRNTRRIDLLSTSKPMINTHYRSKMIATLGDTEICLPNGLDYKYYDAQSHEYVGELTFEDDIPLACTYKMPSPGLQRFIFRPASAPDGPAPNTVIASQDACPENMSLEEYKELGTIPLGHHIQWANILLQLAMPSIDFKKPETTLLLLQCAYQSGPSSADTLHGSDGPCRFLRSSHEFFASEENGQCLLQHLNEALGRVKSNWESSQALFIFVALAARALSLSPFPDVHKACLIFLDTARTTAMDWVNSLKDKAYAAVKAEDKTMFISKSVEVALICTSTFDIDDKYLESVLAVEENASILVQASIVVQEGEQTQASDREQLLHILGMSRKRLLSRAHNIHAKSFTGLDDAISKAWSAYVPGSSWRVESESADAWASTDTLATTQVASMRVHYNLLSGELLVNGLPLDQPPQTYRSHPLFSMLFGRTVVEIMPSTTPGFQFSTKREFAGFSVQLGMSSFGDLIVRATKGDTTYETIPNRLVEFAFPASFGEDYVHWFNAATHTVQFRPITEPWHPSSQDIWTLSKCKEKWRLSRSGCSVITMSSLTSQRLSHVLDPLADKSLIHGILQPSEDQKTLMVSIPTLNLRFSLAQGSASLESKEYRCMAVDADQSMGTLVGLYNKIVLKHLTRNDRMVLIPESETVHYQRGTGGHMSVAVSKQSIHRIHALDVDSKLGRLVGNNDLSCKLFLAYLHALTSFCLPDPLTQKTGTEQALTILTSAAVRSFDQLSQGHLDLLAKIAALSPGRRYYPDHLRVMQTVEWDNKLSFLSQHGHFITTVKSLLKQATQAMIFFPDLKLAWPALKKIDDHLLKRDNIRSASFRVSGFGAEDHTDRSDKQYAARDHNLDSQRGARASTMSRLIMRRGVGRFHPAPEAGSLWSRMTCFGVVYGPEMKIWLSSMRYDASLFKDGHDFVAQRLPALDRCLGSDMASQKCRFSVMMWLATMASEPNADLIMFQTVAMMLKSTALGEVGVLERGSFKPQAGITCSKNSLRPILERFGRPFESCPERNLDRRVNEKLHKYRSRCHAAWHSARSNSVEDLVEKLASQWPCEVPFTPAVTSTYIKVEDAMKEVRALFKTWHDNKSLHQYLASVERTMSTFDHESIEAAYPCLTINKPQIWRSICGYESEHSVFQVPAPKLPKPPKPPKALETRQNLGHTLKGSTDLQDRHEPPRLESVIKTLEASPRRSHHETKYLGRLRASLDALVSRDADELPPSTVPAEVLSSYLSACTKHVNKVYDILQNAGISPSSGTRLRFQRPRVSPTFFLQQLSRSRWGLLGSDRWKACIVKYALALTAMQRAERLTLTEAHDLAKELQNPGHLDWDPAENPEKLLMEVESSFLIRPVQMQVAAQMQDPPDGENAVMQLNMGEGKSSVIVPVAAAALANGEQLVRVIVAKPQFKQMTQMLVSKLGGLLDRRVYYMPISRSLKLDKTAADHMSDMLADCMSSGGVLLIQPEHILSFQLMTLESCILGRQDVGRQLMSTQDFLEHTARDIVDESDENFSVKFELIYTMGAQRPIELSPDRWVVLQQVLDLVRLVAPAVARDLPHSLELHQGVPGSFPRIRILRPDAGSRLKQCLAERICSNGLDAFPISRQPEEIRNAVHTYISKAELNAAEISAVEGSQFWTETTIPHLLLLRGIIACGVLEFVLAQKRWRVNYGLASRTPPTQLAVPYRAKDSPSLRSEFSHPDVVIALTSLSYYYGGLSDDDLFTAMGHLMEADQSKEEYKAWVRDAHNLHDSFKELQGINLKDRPLCTRKVFPALRFAKSVNDFFLAHIVFPKQMKEFPLKLSSSGWDIGKRKNRPVTGFSGTNDSRCVLPTAVHQIDQPAQEHTNALVLEYILQPENGVSLMEPARSGVSDAEHLLDTVMHLDPPVQVILDVGAQILELNNIEVVKTWLKKLERDATKEAAVFVNDEDELCVVDREGRIDLLRASPFLARLDSCLIFLDEAHTRGIDLRLPSDYRAAVTLGAGLTKDRLVQACMRMRKLGKGQTVVFCISEEIQARIRERKTPDLSPDITVEDVIVWSISETHTDIRRSMPLWAVQGERFVRQRELWQQAHQGGRTLMSQGHAEEFQEAEAQSLDDRFRPRRAQNQHFDLAHDSDPDLRLIRERCQEFGELQYNSSTLQEEQERELSPEIEQERQVQRAPPASPAPHKLHEDVRRFAIDGVFTSSSIAFMPAFESLRDSSAAKDFPVEQLAGRDPRLLVTADFARTVKTHNLPSYISDAFQRPVQWLLTSRARGTTEIDRIVIISPFEANQLYRHMEHSAAASLHVYKPRCNSGYGPLDALGFHVVTGRPGPRTVPRGLAMQLCLFSGQLYIGSYGDYKEICSFLGLFPQALSKELSRQGWKVAADGFILSDDEGRPSGGAGLTKSPVSFLKILMSKIRRNGDGISKTDMGGLLEGQVFHPSDFVE